MFERTIKPGKVVYDLGGNVGYYTLLSSILVGESGVVVSFEPLPGNLYYLKRHLDINHIKNATVIEAAVSDIEGTMDFEEGPSNFMGKLLDGGSLKVKSVALDKLIQRGAIPEPDYLKIDIEGGEYLALMGAKNAILLRHPTIFLATHGSKVHMDCLALLSSHGYQLQSINKGKSLEQTDEILATYS